jgi:hypothetical protein
MYSCYWITCYISIHSFIHTHSPSPARLAHQSFAALICWLALFIVILPPIFTILKCLCSQVSFPYKYTSECNLFNNLTFQNTPRFAKRGTTEPNDLNTYTFSTSG